MREIQNDTLSHLRVSPRSTVVFKGSKHKIYATVFQIFLVIVNPIEI